jgi:peptide methionine sulfoxide reductase MsrA
MENKNLEYATFGGGCFWCVEACFDMLKGVESVTSGYSGGQRKPNLRRSLHWRNWACRSGSNCF